MALAHVWGWFLDIFQPGGVGFGSYRPSFEEIHRYATDVLGFPMRSVEVMAIRKLADTYITVEREMRKRNQAVTPTSKSSPVLKKSVSMSDTDGLKALFSRVGNRPASKGNSSRKTPKPSA